MPALWPRWQHGGSRKNGAEGTTASGMGGQPHLEVPSSALGPGVCPVRTAVSFMGGLSQTLPSKPGAVSPPGHIVPALPGWASGDSVSMQGASSLAGRAWWEGGASLGALARGTGSCPAREPAETSWA